MAMTELQRPTKTDFYRAIASQGKQFYAMFDQMESTAEFLNGMDADTLDAMGVPASGSDEGLRTDLVQLRTALNEMVAFYKGLSTTQTNVPKEVINATRSM